LTADDCAGDRQKQSEDQNVTAHVSSKPEIEKRRIAAELDEAGPEQSAHSGRS
jgi:hypothetical protein